MRKINPAICFLNEVVMAVFLTKVVAINVVIQQKSGEVRKINDKREIFYFEAFPS